MAKETMIQARVSGPITPLPAPAAPAVAARSLGRPRRLPPRQGEPHAEPAAHSGLAADGDGAAHALHQVLHDREAEARSPQLAAARLVHAIETLEQPRQVLGPDAR